MPETAALSMLEALALLTMTTKSPAQARLARHRQAQARSRVRSLFMMLQSLLKSSENDVDADDQHLPVRPPQAHGDLLGSHRQRIPVIDLVFKAQAHVVQQVVVDTENDGALEERDVGA